MWITYWNAFHEALSRRMIMVLVGIAIVTAGVSNRNVAFSVAHGVSVVTMGARSMGPWPLGVPSVLGFQMGLAGNIWLLLVIFAAAPGIAATFDKGWIDLIFTKRTERWKILLGRYLCGLTLYFMMVLLATSPLAIRLWWATRIPTAQITGAVLIETLSFASLLAVAALASLARKGISLPIMASVGIWALSPLLRSRQTNYYDAITSTWGRAVIDWLYYVLPKCSELDNVSAHFIQYSAVSNSWALWTTGLFTLSILGLTVWLLERKSF